MLGHSIRPGAEAAPLYLRGGGGLLTKGAGSPSCASVAVSGSFDAGMGEGAGGGGGLGMPCQVCRGRQGVRGGRKNMDQGRHLRKGGGLFKSRHPIPPPPNAPKVLEPGVLQFEILGETVGAKGARILFFWLLEGGNFSLYVYTQNTQNFVENSKMGEKHRKIFDP